MAAPIIPSFDGRIVASWEGPGDEWETQFPVDETQASSHSTVDSAEDVLSGLFSAFVLGDDVTSPNAWRAAYTVAPFSGLRGTFLFRTGAVLLAGQSSPDDGGEIAVLRVETADKQEIAAFFLWRRLADEGVFLGGRIFDGAGARTQLLPGLPIGRADVLENAAGEAVTVEFEVQARRILPPFGGFIRVLQRSAAGRIDHGSASVSTVRGEIGRVAIGVSGFVGDDHVEYFLDDLILDEHGRAEVVLPFTAEEGRAAGDSARRRSRRGRAFVVEGGRPPH